MVQNIFIARHGARQDSIEPDWHARASWPDDTCLSATGHAQAKQLALRLLDEDIRHIFSSPFLRAIETASHLADALRLKIKLATGLGEWYSSSFFQSEPRLMPLADKLEKFSQIEPGQPLGPWPVFPETSAQMQARVQRAVLHILANYRGNLVFVGHGASVAAAAGALAGQHVLIDTKICSLTQLQKSAAGWNLLLNGDTSHLA